MIEHFNSENYFCCYLIFIYFKILFIFRERARERERGRETSVCGCLSRAPIQGMWSATQICAFTGNQTSDPLVRRPVLNLRSYTSWALFFFKQQLLCCFTASCTFIMVTDCTLGFKQCEIFVSYTFQKVSRTLKAFCALGDLEILLNDN